jgi:hypothetical protein
VCSVNDVPNSFERQWIVNSTSDLDAFPENCTTLIDGDLLIGESFSGIFKLNGVLNMTGGLFALWVRWSSRREKVRREKNAPTGVELETRQPEEDVDHPPDYNSVAETEAGNAHSEETAVQARGRDEALPEYTPRGTT